MKPICLCLAAAVDIAALPAWAEPLTFDDLYRGVSECRFDLSRYTDVPMSSGAEAVLISLPTGGAMRGLLINTFYFAPAKAGKGENYGLVFNAPLDAA
jgi:hypothetical protein